MTCAERGHWGPQPSQSNPTGWCPPASPPGSHSSSSKKVPGLALALLSEHTQPNLSNSGSALGKGHTGKGTPAQVTAPAPKRQTASLRPCCQPEARAAHRRQYPAGGCEEFPHQGAVPPCPRPLLVSATPWPHPRNPSCFGLWKAWGRRSSSAGRPTPHPGLTWTSVCPQNRIWGSQSWPSPPRPQQTERVEDKTQVYMASVALLVKRGHLLVKRNPI